ncbi:MAG: bile acid:sodium symporter family protein [Candidatus Latescibacterota bacterium]
MEGSSNTMRKRIYSLFFGLTIFCFTGIIAMIAMGMLAISGPLFVGFFAFLALYSRGNETLKGFSFTIWIFAAVSVSMFYPFLFLQWGSYKLTKLIEPLMMIIMFGMGTTMSLRDFSQILRMPKGVLIGMGLQFTVMPFVGFTIAKTFGFAPEIAAGVILIGCVPSGLASNVMNYIAGSNLALSVTITACATLVAPLMTPIWMKFLAGQFVPIDFMQMMWGVVRITIIPVAAGLLFNHFMHGKVNWLDRFLPVVSMGGIVVIIVVITSAGRNDLLTVGLMLLAAEMIHNTTGYLGGYWGSRLCGLDEKSCRTVAIEVGLQNGGMGSALAINVLKSPAAALAPAIFGPWMNISGSVLANWWHAHPVKDEKKPSSDVKKAENKIN